MIEQKDLLLVPFPFSDQKGRKVRPVIVISNNEFNRNSEDILVVAVTSNFSKDKYALPLENSDLSEGSLTAKCVVKCENILKIDKEIVLKKIGKIQNNKLDSIKKIIFDIMC